MSYLELFWSLLNGVSDQRMGLVIYPSFSFAYPLFVSLKIFGVSITYSGYWYPHSLDKFPATQNPNSLQCSHSLQKGLAIQKNPRNSRSYQQRSMELSFSLKKWWWWKEEKKRSSTLHSKRVAKWGVQIKRPNSIQVCVHFSLSLVHFIFHMIGIWLSTNLLWITLRLDNIGNQGMQSLPTYKLHISALE